MILAAATAAMVSFWGPYFPPPEFDHPFRGDLFVEWATGDEIWNYCPSFGVACVIRKTPTECLVFINLDYIIYKDRILRHEIGHCNGWPSNHPNPQQ